MKAKISRGAGFRGALNYVLEEGAKQAQIVGGTMDGRTPRELAAEFSGVRKLRADIAKPVWHASLSAPPGERLSDEQWRGVTQGFMSKMGFSGSTPYVVVRHQDTGHDHVHIVASRIDLAGKVWLGQWEARRAIEATQALEKEHGLTLTAGLGEARAEQKKLTAAEINMAVRTGQEPPRQRLQRLVDAATERGDTVVQFAEWLTAAGVTVRPNLASTGRLNGFAFEVEGVHFKGSDLGKAYTWKGLQDRGITYEQARDREGLERFRATTRNHQEHQSVTPGVELAAGRTDGVAGHGGERDSQSPGAPAAAGQERDLAPGRLPDPPGRGGERDSASLGAPAEAERGREEGPGSLRPGDGGAEADLGRNGPGNASEGLGNRPAGIGRADGDPPRPASQQRGDRAHSGASPEGARIPGGDERGHAPDSPDAQRPTDRAAEPPVADGGDRAGERPDIGLHRLPAWNERFKRASAARRRDAERGAARPDAPGPGLQRGVRGGQPEGQRLAPEEIRGARAIDPTTYLESQGFTVQHQGKNLSVRRDGDEYYRVTQKDDGHWVSCDLHGNGIGDNIALVHELEPEKGFAEAVYALNGAPSAVPPAHRPAPQRQLPSLPKQTEADRKAGRSYLQNRGIDLDIIEAAERAGFVRYTSGAALFVGYDQGGLTGLARCVTRRAIERSDPIQKRELRGSDKRYPPILPGNPKSVWIVEGGVDALALHNMAKHRGEAAPTVIVSGGANVRSFLDTEPIRTLLRRADRVVIARDNERDPAIQARTDLEHDQQRERVHAITGKEVMDWKSDRAKDLAQHNEWKIGRGRGMER